MAGFVNRRSELATLDRWWKAERSRPGLIWGRRRVGKTALITHFAQDKRMVFYTGIGGTAELELQGLSEEAAFLSTPERDLIEQPFRDWRDAFRFLAARAEEAPLLLVLDEFPELLAGSPELPGLMRAELDRHGGQPKLKILLSGSSMRAMWQMQEYRAPLYGRFDLTMQLHPFRPHEVSEILTRLSPADRALVYGILGGIPLYLTMWDQDATIGENLTRLLLSGETPLYNEGKLVLATELGSGRLTSQVLSAIAAGRTRFHEIADAVGTDPTRTIERLTQLRLIDRVIPVTEDPAKHRRRIYRIRDSFLRFHLGVLMRYHSRIEAGSPETVLPAVMSSLDDFMGIAWEQAFRDHLSLRAVEIDPETVDIGPWWRGDGKDELDAVVLAGRGRTPVLVGEAKWAKKVRAQRLLNRMRTKATNLVDDPETLRFAIAARESVEDAPEEVWTFTAADIFSARA
ncbi:ATP-binding protein [Natronoglycomyces albus]|uniref:ATP-binding protein n=1 Tax=Natronoglycomyces albus TaxID=2811108 RepID=A0A895XIR8_9ACTN|nr:ATP-binding protein [Natronoglycomyces albus]QSB05234.1 ATP-binding protein [Natronoglycomyces albus]